MTADRDLRALFDSMTTEEQEAIMADLPESVAEQLLSSLGVDPASLPSSPLGQAQEIDSGYVIRPHLQYLSDRLAQAVEDVRHGISRRLVISMPPRSGKTEQASIYLPLWLLRLDPTWKVGLISHDPTLATAWGRRVRAMIEDGVAPGIDLASDAGAASEWQTTNRGGVTSRSTGQSIIGRGFNILIIDDVVKDFAAAHSETNRDAVWNWWAANAQTRLEPPSLVVVIGTRWHEDDFIGRLLDPQREGDPADWEVIAFPAIAEEADVLGRAPGEPLLSPLIPDETPDEALIRWGNVKRDVGLYTWSAQFQQRPAPAQGAIFSVGDFRYWTTVEALATEDGSVRWIDPNTLVGAQWVDSWDAAFKGTEDSDYVVGQRWVRHGGNRYLIAQVRGRWTFTATIREMRAFNESGPYHQHVHKRLVEDKANGPAIMDVLHDEFAGLKPVEPNGSKEARARAITPEIESHNVYLPLPVEQPWVLEFISEVRSFPTGAHDDMVDTMSQALWDLRDPGKAMITNPATRGRTIPTGAARASAARTGVRRSRGG